jgi:hypothetical protein
MLLTRNTVRGWKKVLIGVYCLGKKTDKFVSEKGEIFSKELVFYHLPRRRDIMTSMIRIMVALMITLFGLLPIFQLAHAEVFKWVDEKGTVHFTEDPATIPEKYREKTESRTTEEDLMTLEQRIMLKKKEEAELKERIKREKKEAELKSLEEQLKKVSESVEKESREAERKREEADRAPSPGYIPFEKFKYVQKGMTEAEVLSRFGPPTRVEEDEVKSKGKVAGGSVSGHVSPSGSFSGSVSESSFKGETVIVKRYYYIGDRSKGEQTRIITFEKGKVVSYSSIY